MQALINSIKLQAQFIIMEKSENKKRRPRERQDHEKKKRKKKNHNLLKTNANKLELRHNDVSDPRHIYDLDRNDNHHRDRTEDDENLNHFELSSSSSDGLGESGIFDFPWLKDEDCMFKTDDVDELCRSSLEDMASVQQMSFNLYSDHLHDHDTEAWIEINQDSDKQEYCVDSKSDCASSDFDQENELGRVEYYIWTNVLNQPLN